MTKRSKRNRKRKEVAPVSSATITEDLDVMTINVIWDMENCCIPSKGKPREICEKIRTALGSRDPVDFFIYCDFTAPKRIVGAQIMEAECNANVEYVPSGVPDYGDKVMISKIHALAAASISESNTFERSNHFLFITGDVDFCSTLSMLRQQNFTVGVACIPNSSSQILKWAASYVLD